MKRSKFIKQASLLSMGAVLSSFTNNSVFGKKTKILLRSSWQTVNIGDIGHTPGVLHLLEKYLPDAEVRLWAGDVRNGVSEMILKRFPNLEIFTSSDTETLKKAFLECDFLLHGSGPSLVAERDVKKWDEATGKPYGIYGITYNEGSMSENANALLSKAEFVFFRDTFSLKYAKSIGVNSKIMEFGPDGAFAVDTFDPASAKAFLAAHDLEEGKFMCAIPKYRYTPYWLIPSKNASFNKERDAINQANKEHDHKELRNAIIAVVEQTDLKILIVPEDETQVAIGKEMLYDPLPENIKKRVVWRDHYWLTDEAVSTYKLSAGVFGNEQHSPIMSVGNGIPAVVCRYKEQTSKGIMWRDIGLGEWLFDLDVEAEMEGIVPAVLDIALNPEKAKGKVKKARQIVEKRQKETMMILRDKVNY